MDLYRLPFPIEDYCYATGYDGPLTNSPNVISALHRSQLMNIPFENFDVLQGKPISLEPEDIVNKLLYHARGGYCYELNGLFSMLLQHLKVPHSMLLARPMFYPETRPRTHMVIVAELKRQLYLLDVGFGSYGPREPVRLMDLDTPQQQGNEAFMISQTSDSEFILHARVDDQWHSQYAFNLTPQQWVDFIPANYFNSTHPNSIFTQKPVVILHTPEGRNILFGNQLKILVGATASVRTIEQDQLNDVLENEFGIELQANNVLTPIGD